MANCSLGAVITVSMGTSHNSRLSGSRRGKKRSDIVGREAVGSGISQGLRHARDFGARGSFSEVGEAVVAAALVFAGFSAGFLNQPKFEQALDGAIKGTGAQSKFAAGALLHILHNGVAVGVTGGEGDQDLEEGRGEGKQRMDVHIVPVSILTVTILEVNGFLAGRIVLDISE